MAWLGWFLMFTAFGCAQESGVCRERGERVARWVFVLIGGLFMGLGVVVVQDAAKAGSVASQAQEVSK